MRPTSLRLTFGLFALTLQIAVGLQSFSAGKDELLVPSGTDSALNSTTFDAFGAVGDGRHIDQSNMQAALNARAGGTIYGLAGKTYTLRGQVYVPSNTTIDCRGAVVQFDPTLGSLFVNALFWIGYWDGGGASNVEIRNCKFESVLAYQNAAIMFQPGSHHVWVHDNDFRSTAGYALRAINLGAARVSDIRITDNTAEDVAYLLFLNGDEMQAFIHCYNVLDGLPCGSSGPHPPPPGTTTTSLPAAAVEDIGKGYLYGVGVLNRSNGFNSYRLYDPANGGDDFNYSDGMITFVRALPSDPGTDVKVFTWNPNQGPANDARNIAVTGNVGRRFRAAAVQINCPVRAMHRRTPGQDCVRGVVVSDNRFDGAYQLEGMFNSFPLPGARTNFALWSQDFSKSEWVRRGQLMPRTGVDPPPYDNTKTAQHLTEDTSNGGHAINQNIKVAAGSPHSWSCSLRAAERSKARLDLLTNAGNGVTAAFDLATGRIIERSGIGSGTGGNAGINPQGNGWYRAWVTGVLDGAVAQPAIHIQDMAGRTSYPGDGVSGIDAWGCELESRAIPSVYLPTRGSATSNITAQLISINGVYDFTVANNLLGPAADQCIHLEDHAGRGTVENNVCRDAGGVGIYLGDTHSIIVKNNTITNSYTGCIQMDYSNPAPPTLEESVAQIVDATLAENKCDGAFNPSLIFGLSITPADVPGTASLIENHVINLPPGTPEYRFLSGRP